MKTLGLLALFFGLSVQAQNPQIRVCNTTGGNFHVVDFPNTSDYAPDQVGFCQYGSAMLDAVSIMGVVAGEKKSMAVRAFEKTQETMSEDCGEGSWISGQNPDEESTDACKFSDYSVIEKRTLLRGYSAGENQGLVKALEIRY